MPEELPKDRLRQARQAAGLTRQQLADRIDRSLSTIRANENGQNNITPEAATLYAKELGVNPTWLLFGFSPSAGSQAVMEVKINFLPLMGDLRHNLWQEDARYGETETGTTMSVPAWMFDEKCKLFTTRSAYIGYIIDDIVVTAKDDPGTIVDQDHVVVRRIKGGFSLLTLFHVEQRGGEFFILSIERDEDDPDGKRAPLPTYDGDEMQLVGVVVGRLGLAKISGHSRR